MAKTLLFYTIFYHYGWQFFSTTLLDFTPVTTDPFLGSIFGGIILGIGVDLLYVMVVL